MFFDASIDATTWLWDFGDGVTSNAPQSPPYLQHTRSEGRDTHRFEPEWDRLDNVLVGPRLQPTARFVVSSNTIRAGESIVFTDESVNAVSWFWDFGDGVVSGSQNPIHVYAESGTYSAFLTVESLTGDSANFGPVVISVDPAVDPAAPAISISIPGSAPVGLVTLTGVQLVGSGPIVTWQWQVARGSDVESYAGKVVKGVLFSEAGVYHVQLTAEGPVEDTVVRQNITITLPPTTTTTVPPTTTTTTTTTVCHPPRPTTTTTTVPPTTTTDDRATHHDHHDRATHHDHHDRATHHDHHDRATDHDHDRATHQDHDHPPLEHCGREDGELACYGPVRTCRHMSVPLTANAQPTPSAPSPCREAP